MAVGYALGGASAMALHSLAESSLLPLLHKAPHALMLLYWATAAAVLAFAAVSSKSWASDAALLLRAARLVKTRAPK